MSGFQGILFTLKKRKQDPGIPDKDYYDFITFGYYDGLSVSYIDRWYQFRPAEIAKSCGYVSLGDPFADIYVIKGFFPYDKDEYVDLLDYDFWLKVGNRNLKDKRGWKEANTILAQSPYICASSIHLSQDFVRQCKDLNEMTKDVIYQFKESAAAEGKNLKEFHCAVFPIIGFSDYIIAFTVNDFEMPTRFISRLREWKTEGSNMAVISDCYTICGVYKDFEITKDNFNTASKVRLIAEFNLREGVSAKKFHAVLKNRILEKLEKLGIDREWREKVECELSDYYVTFGSKDTLVVPNVNIESYLSLFMSEEFQPGNAFYGQFISGTKTSICVSDETTNMEYSDVCQVEENENTVVKQGIPDAWKQFPKEFEEQLRKKNYSVRMSRAMEQIIQNYSNIANTSHGFDIKNSLGKFIGATLSGIRKCWQDENADWEEINHVVREFRDRVGDFVADLLRSDKPFMEGNTLSHPTIGSATKILFAYTAILNNMAHQMCDNDQEIVFLVISGGADAITAINLFAFLNTKRKPVLIVVPEKGLYDIKGTLFRMLHVCMHFCGEHLRMERYDSYLRIMSELMAYDMVEILFGENFVEEYLSSEEIYLTPDKYAYLLERVKQRVKEQREGIKEEIKKCICEYKDFTNYRERYQDEKYYCECVLFRPYSPRNHNAGILSEERIADIWNRQEGALSGEIADIISKAEEKLYREISKTLQQENVNALISDIRAERLTLSKRKGKDARIKTYLHIYGSALVDNYNVGIVKMKNVWYNYGEISRLGFWSMREGRADLFAIRLLKMDVEDYLLAFIYEEKDIDRTMPKTLDNILRMGSVLKVGFGCTKHCIGKDIRTKILTYAERIKEGAGYEYEDKKDHMEDYLNQYMDRMAELLDVYENEKWRGIATEVEKYLEDVSAKLEENDEIRELQRIYKKCGMTDRENAYEMIAYLFAQWGHLGKEEENETAGYTN